MTLAGLSQGPKDRPLWQRPLFGFQRQRYTVKRIDGRLGRPLSLCATEI